MKKILSLTTFSFYLLVFNFLNAQIPPQVFNYSAVARNIAGQPIATSIIGIQISILKTSTSGAVQYMENHFVNTDDYGLFNLIVGGGAIQSGSMSSIDWSLDNYYLKVGMDAAGGTNFLSMGTTQLLSVPYALHAATADSLIGGVAGFSGNYTDLTNVPNLSSVAISGDYLDLANQPVTINSISSFGDTLYLSNGEVFISASNSAFSGDYNDLTNTPAIPTNVSSLTNDAGFVTTDNDHQQLSVSAAGDTLFLSNGNWVIIPGISTANTAGQLATLSTTVVSSITGTTAVSGGNITNSGGSNITARGIVWSTNQNPTIGNNLGSTTNGSGTGSFISNLAGLIANTTYYIKAYATNSAGTAYGNELSFTTTIGGVSFTGDWLNSSINYGSVTDIDGNVYPTVILNGQEWMAENLRSTRYANGDTIPNVSDPSIWSNLSSGAWSYYNNDSSYNIPYGKIYNWFCAADSRNACPVGWHVSSKNELATIDCLQSFADQYWAVNQIGSVNNSTGLSLLAGGMRDENGTSYLLYPGPNNGIHAGFYVSSTISDNNIVGCDPINCGYFAEFNSNPIFDLYPYNKKMGGYIRCVKD